MGNINADDYFVPGDTVQMVVAAPSDAALLGKLYKVDSVDNRFVYVLRNGQHGGPTAYYAWRFWLYNNATQATVEANPIKPASMRLADNVWLGDYKSKGQS